MSLNTTAIPIYNDNYVWIMHDDDHAIVVDPGLADPVNEFLKQHNLKLAAILITHHHWDHINGLQTLYADWQCDVFGPKDDRIPDLHINVKEGDVVYIDAMAVSFNVIETPGHTLSHICFYNDTLIFCGDTLFSLGCGRMFEGTAEQYVTSLHKIKTLPDQTLVYCTHEYTLSNIRFIESIGIKSSDLNNKKAWVQNQLSQNKPSIPFLLRDELKLNPFLKTDDKNFQKRLAKKFNSCIEDEYDAFAQLREAKDNF